MLSTKVVNISNQLEALLENLVKVTGGDNIDKLNAVLSDVEGITGKLDSILDTNENNINQLISDVGSVVAKVDRSLDHVEKILIGAESAVQRVASPQNVRQMTSILDSVKLMSDNVTARTSDKELGAAIQNFNRLLTDTNVTVLRLRSDMQRVMRDLETGVENINEFTQMLIENPSVLISGRSEKERRLP